MVWQTGQFRRPVNSAQELIIVHLDADGNHRKAVRRAARRPSSQPAGRASRNPSRMYPSADPVVVAARPPSLQPGSRGTSSPRPMISLATLPIACPEPHWRAQVAGGIWGIRQILMTSLAWVPCPSPALPIKELAGEVFRPDSRPCSTSYWMKTLPGFLPRMRRSAGKSRHKWRMISCDRSVTVSMATPTR